VPQQPVRRDPALLDFGRENRLDPGRLGLLQWNTHGRTIDPKRLEKGAQLARDLTGKSGAGLQAVP
jgi:hypothetical protein